MMQQTWWWSSHTIARFLSFSFSLTNTHTHIHLGPKNEYFTLTTKKPKQKKKPQQQHPQNSNASDWKMGKWCLLKTKNRINSTQNELAYLPVCVACIFYSATLLIDGIFGAVIYFILVVALSLLILGEKWLERWIFLSLSHGVWMCFFLLLEKMSHLKIIQPVRSVCYLLFVDALVVSLNCQKAYFVGLAHIPLRLPSCNSKA